MSKERFSIGVKGEAMRLVADLWPSSVWLQKRARGILDTVGFKDFLQPEGQYLDIGTGKGHVMEEAEKEGAKFIGVDRYDYPSKRVKKRSHVPFAFADAIELPFKDRFFDGASLIFVLHHMSPEEQLKALEEAKRVVGDGQNQYIFMTEDVVDSNVQREITERRDRRLNVESKKESHFYRSDDEWKSLFTDLKLEVVKSVLFTSKTRKGEVKHAAYVLRKLE